jgi:hypothetical protein
MDQYSFKHTDQDADIKIYLEILQSEFCPYIGPAESMGSLLFLTSNEFYPGALAEADFFCASLRAIELFRSHRRGLSKADAQLLCYNIILPTNSVSSGATAESILTWSHWLLKLLFSRCNVMFGKFWVGQALIGRNGHRIPSPPVNFLSIRTGVVSKDKKLFFSHNTEVRPLVASVADVSEFDPISSLIYEDWSGLDSLELYERVCRWAMTNHPPSDASLVH